MQDVYQHLQTTVELHLPRSPQALLRALVSTGWAVRYRAFSSEATGSSVMYLPKAILGEYSCDLQLRRGMCVYT